MLMFRLTMVELDLGFKTYENILNTTLKTNVALEEKFAIIRRNQVYVRFAEF